MKAVLDTNIIISALNFPGNERLVLDLARRGIYELYLSPFILAEAAGLLRRKFRWEEAQTERAIALLELTASMIHPPEMPPVIGQGHADNRILECAVAASADYPVTGDRRHLLPLQRHWGTEIVNSPRFLAIISASAENGN